MRKHKKSALEKEVARKEFWGSLKMNKWLYVMMIPGILYYIIFSFMPFEGLRLAFFDYSPMEGLQSTKYIGFQYFEMLFTGNNFWQLFGNTLILSLLSIVFYFPLPIIIALMLNEIRCQWFKKTVQNIIYIPHFFSWVVIASISYQMFTVDGGAINNVLQSMTGNTVNFLTSAEWLRPLAVGQQIWKDVGWGSIIYLSAMASVDAELYEAAAIDGANRWKRMLHITLPCIATTITILLILKMGSVMSTNFDQMLLLVNSGNRSVGEVFDTYIYEQGIKMGRFSYTTAVGLFKSLVGFILVMSSNWISKRCGGEGVI